MQTFMLSMVNIAYNTAIIKLYFGMFQWVKYCTEEYKL